VTIHIGFVQIPKNKTTFLCGLSFVINEASDSKSAYERKKERKKIIRKTTNKKQRNLPNCLHLLPTIS
jgi:hypothetical protein